MHAKSAAAVALLAAAPVANAAGATIKNHCNFPVYLWTVSDFASPMQTIAPGKSFSQGYLTNPNGGGVSMKVSPTPDLGGQVTQFEYTLTDTLWYDMSNVNGNPFAQYGMKLVPSDSSCRSVMCPAGAQTCHAAYTNPYDDWATAACQPGADTTLNLCHANKGVPAASAGQVLNAAAQEPKKAHGKKAHGKSHKHKHQHAAPAPAPAPAPVPAPAAPVVAAAGAAAGAATGAAAGAMTTFVTQVVTVTARAASPTAL